MKIIINEKANHCDIGCLEPSDTFTMMNPRDVETRYMVMEHCQNHLKDHDIIVYVCLNTGIIYKQNRYEDKTVRQVYMEARDVN